MAKKVETSSEAPDLNPSIDSEKKIETGQPEYIKTIQELIVNNPSILSELQSLTDKMFAKHNKGEKGWGWDIDNFRKIFTKALPKEVKKAPSYKKAIRGMDGKAFAEFANNFVKEIQTKPVVETTQPPEEAPQETLVSSPEDYSANLHRKIETEIAQSEQVLSNILPEFEKQPFVYAYGQGIYDAAKQFGVAPRQAVRILYKHYGQEGEFNNRRKDLKTEPHLAPEQVLLKQLAELKWPRKEVAPSLFEGPKVAQPQPESLEKFEPEEKKNYLITKPYEDGHRYLLLDHIIKGAGGKPDKNKRYGVQLPLGADIGNPDNLYKIADFLGRRELLAPINAPQWPEGLRTKENKPVVEEILSATEFEQEWQKRQSPQEKERIKNRKAFIEQAKPVFDSNPTEFITKNKLIEFTTGIPNEDAVNYIVDESLVGEARVKEYRQFKELEKQPNENLGQFVGLDTYASQKLSREQLLLDVLAQLIEQADKAKAKKDAKKERVVGQDTNKSLPDIHLQDKEVEDLEKYENHPDIQEARAVAEADIKDQIYGQQKLNAKQQSQFEDLFRAYWNIQKEITIKKYLEAGLLK